LRLRLKSHEKTSININNNISYNSEKKENNFRIVNNNKKEKNTEIILFQEKNNSFCLGEDKSKLKQIFIKSDDHNLNTSRIHLNKKYRLAINEKKNNIKIITDFNNCSMNNIFNNRFSVLPKIYNLINLYNNNFLNFNTIKGRSSSFINNTSFNLFNDNNYINEKNKIKNSTSINIEDLIILQEKLKYIILALNRINTVPNECFECFEFLL